MENGPDDYRAVQIDSIPDRDKMIADRNKTCSEADIKKADASAEGKQDQHKNYQRRNVVKILGICAVIEGLEQQERGVDVGS